MTSHGSHAGPSRSSNGSRPHSAEATLSSLPSALDRVGTALAAAPMVGSLLKQVTPGDFHSRAEALHTGPVAQALSVIAGEDVLTKSTGSVVKALATALDFPYGAASLIGYVAEQLAAPATALLVTDDRIRAHSSDALLIADAANCARLGVLGRCPSWGWIQEGDRAESISHQLERLAESIRDDKRAPSDPIDIAAASFAPRIDMQQLRHNMESRPAEARDREVPENVATGNLWDTSSNRPSSEPTGTAPRHLAPGQEDRVAPAELRADSDSPDITLTHTAASALAKLLTAGRWATRREYVVAGMLLEQLRQQIDEAERSG